jgi:hypothetical protein
VLHSITARFCLRSYDSAICLPFFKYLSRDYEKTTSPFFGQGTTSFFFLMVICNSLLMLKSLPINIINCIKFYVNCSVCMIGNTNICLFICKSSPMIHCGLQLWVSTFPRFVAIGFYFLSETLI